MQMGVEVRKPCSAEMEAVARRTLKARWDEKGGGSFTETVTERDASFSIDWISKNG